MVENHGPCESFELSIVQIGLETTELGRWVSRCGCCSHCALRTALDRAGRGQRLCARPRGGAGLELEDERASPACAHKGASRWYWRFCVLAPLSVRETDSLREREREKERKRERKRERERETCAQRVGFQDTSETPHKQSPPLSDARDGAGSQDAQFLFFFFPSARELEDVTPNRLRRQWCWYLWKVFFRFRKHRVSRWARCREAEVFVFRFFRF